MRKKRFKLHKRLKQATRGLRHRMIIPVLELLRWLVKAIPHRFVLAMGRRLGGLARFFCPRFRRLAERQLAEAGIGETPRERKQIVRGVFETLGMNLLEWLQAPSWSEAQARERYRTLGFETIEAALENGTGFIMVAGHLGNWELVPYFYHLTSGHRACVVSAGQSSPEMERYLTRMREQLGCDVRVMGNSMIGMVRRLRQGEGIGLLGDQDSRRSKGIFVDFFGKPAYTPEGPAALALRTGAWLVPINLYRDPEEPSRHILQVGKPLIPDTAAEPGEEIKRLTQAHARALEELVRQHPEQWVWIHERWKRRPGDRIRPYRGKKKARVAAVRN